MEERRTTRRAALALGVTMLALTGVGVPTTNAASSGGERAAVDAGTDGQLGVAPRGDDAPRFALGDGNSERHAASRDDAFVLTVDLAGSDSIDGVLRFHAGALEFAGATALDPAATLLQNEVAEGVAVTVAGGIDASFEARFVPRLTADVGIALDTAGADGRSVTRSTVVSIRDDRRTGFAIDAPDRTGSLLPSVALGDAADLTGDGRIDALDVVDVQIAWHEQLASGSHCGLADPALASADLNDDGCLGAADLTTIEDEVANRPAGFASPLLAMAGGEGATFVVTDTSDEGDNQLNDDLCITPSGGCSLRAAILQANATPGPNRIEFDIPGPGPHTILLDRKMTTISDATGPLVIDGYTQPGASENTDPLASNAVIQIAIEMETYVNGRATFAITSGGNVIRGLSVYNSYFPFLLMGTEAVDNRIVGNFIGTNPAGTFHLNPGFSNAAGVQFDQGASYNRIGTPEIADRNVMSGNRSWAVRVEQNETIGNIIQNNIIGLNPSGTDRLDSHGGIDVQYGARQTLVGGRALREHNVFAGLVYSGIDFSHNSFENQAIGNYIGTDLTGRQAFEWTESRYGLLVKDDARLNYYEGNVVANQTSEGIYNKHNYTGGNTFVGNLVGLTLDGTPAGNGRDGVQLRGHDDVFERNLIANNDQDGINLDSLNDSGPNDDELTERNRLTRNSFWNNGGLGIDITPNGQNTNDVGDGDGGTQAGLNHPELADVSVGTVTGNACAGCTVEVYLADESTINEGRQFLGSVVTDAATGDFTFADTRIVTDRLVTALTIDGLGNTSEFAPSKRAAAMVAWTELQGDFTTTVVDGRDVAIVPEAGAGWTGGADQTSSIVYFDVVAPAAGDYVIDAEVYAPTSVANSFWVVLDGETGAGRLFDTAVSGSLITDTVNQRNVADPVVVTLPAGPKRIGFALREDGTGVARIALRDAAPAPGTAPVITGPGDLTFDRNTPASATVSATPAGATFTAVRLPDGMSIDPDTGVVSGTPTRAGVFPVTFLAHDVEGIDTVDATFTVELEQLPPTVTPIADQMGDLGAAVSLQVEAADPNGDTLLYSATGLPTGLDIDDTTGLIGGTPTEGGDFAVTVSVDDGFGAVDESFDWAIDPGFVCSVTGNTLTWTDQGASTYYIRHIISGDDNYLGPVSGSLEFTVPSQFGTYKVIAYVGGQIEATCDAPLGQPQPFTCSVVGNTLSWTDQGASTYFIRQLINGEDNYLDSVSGALEYAVPSQFGAYKVVAYVGGRIEAQCDAPLGDPQPFSCSVVGDQLTWTNQGASTYHVRQQVSGVDQYVDSTSGLSLTLPDSFGVFEVRFNLNGQLNTTTCDGVLLPDFTCSVDAAGLVTWADQQSLTYSVRRVVDGINSYVGSSSGLTYQLTDLSGDIRVRYSRSGTMFSTACPPV